MRAILMTDTGPAGVLELSEVDEPEITSPTQIKVRLRAASVNPVDTKLRKRGLFYPDALPAVLGCDGAGEVVETGAAVSRFMKGDEVWFCYGGLGAAQGNYAEYTVLDEKEAEMKPRRISFEQAAALPLVSRRSESRADGFDSCRRRWCRPYCDSTGQIGGCAGLHHGQHGRESKLRQAPWRRQGHSLQRL